MDQRKFDQFLDQHTYICLKSGRVQQDDSDRELVRRLRPRMRLCDICGRLAQDPTNSINVRTGQWQCGHIGQKGRRKAWVKILTDK